MSSHERLPRDFYFVTAANFVFFLNFASFFLLPVHLHDLGASAETIGYVMGTAGFAGIVVLPFLGVLLDRVDRRRFVIAGGVIMAAASYAYLLVPGGIIERFGYPLAFAAASACVVCGMGLLWLAPPLSSAVRIASVQRQSREEEEAPCCDVSCSRSSH